MPEESEMRAQQLSTGGDMGGHGGTCPLCNEEYRYYLSDHLPCAGMEAQTDANNQEPLRPKCINCESLADVVLLTRPDPMEIHHPYCRSCEPDPEEHGNKERWADKTPIRDYNDPLPNYTLYGRGGGTTYRGEVIHVEDPSGEDILCHHAAPSKPRYKISHALPEDAHLCGSCVNDWAWAEDYPTRTVGAFVAELQRIVLREDEYCGFHDPHYHVEYPQPSPTENHALAEGVPDLNDRSDSRDSGHASNAEEHNANGEDQPDGPDDTSIRLSTECADVLYEMKERGDSYEDVLWRLIHESGAVNGGDPDAE